LFLFGDNKAAPLSRKKPSSFERVIIAFLRFSN
jgi:hypothetical protein